jgi:AraC family transcriptional regulator
VDDCDALEGATGRVPRTGIDRADLDATTPTIASPRRCTQVVDAVGDHSTRRLSQHRKRDQAMATSRSDDRPMSVPLDTFAAFVEIVAESLDDAIDGDELARRAHLSRSHFDRVVSAVAGEPPAAFTRRLKLERAACELVSCQETVLDVAMRAGYGSHEAFTRAFSRAYGRTPSQWRRHPGPDYRLDAPSGVHFHPQGGVVLPAERKVTSMDLLLRIVKHHVWLVGEILDRVERVDAELLDRPIGIGVEYIDADPTLRSASSRLVGQLAMWNAAVAGRSYDFGIERDESLGSMRRRLADAGPEFVTLAQQLVVEGRLEETFVDTTCEEPQVFTYGGMLAHVLAFGATRRTIVIGALHSAGITDLGAGDPMHWVAEHA